MIFTTIQKFLPDELGADHPMLSDRRNIVVIADEAHRSQYDFVDGFAKHMRDALPGAAFIGFTGTPIETTDKNTQAVFGDYIDVYDIQRAVDDGATIRIYYESRLAKIALNDGLDLDEAFEEVTEGEEETRKYRLKSKWARLEALVGADPRLDEVARDLIAHYETRQEAIEGKAMIVCMSRRICVELYAKIIALRPDWHHGDDDKGAIKVVMTGSKSDPPEWQQHIRPKQGRKALAERFKDPSDPFRIVLEVIEELIELAKHMREAKKRGEELGLSDEEIAFYDALAQNGSAVDVLGIPELKVMAVELVEMIRKNVTIDWTVKQSVQANLRRMVKRILRKHGYPPDLQAEAVRIVLKQAKLLCADWAA